MARREASQPQIKLSFDLTLASPDHVTQTLNLCGATGKPAAIARRVSAGRVPWSDRGALRLSRVILMDDDRQSAPMPGKSAVVEPIHPEAMPVILMQERDVCMRAPEACRTSSVNCTVKIRKRVAWIGKVDQLAYCATFVCHTETWSYR